MSANRVTRVIAVGNNRNQIKYLPVIHRAQQLDVLGVSPHERHGRTGRLAPIHERLGKIGLVPNLFRQHAAARAEAFQRKDVRLDVVACRSRGPQAYDAVTVRG